MHPILEKILYSFPVQLVLIHVRRNFALILLWILFVAIITGNFGRVYGVHFLFLDPEYINDVSFWSFFIVGACYGNLVTAFNITCYILDAHRFPFVGVLERPFTKFSINNSLIPFLALVVYLLFIIRFQIQNEYSTGLDVFVNVVGLLLGISVILFLFFLYFKSTNKDIFRFLSGSVDRTLRKSKINRSRVMSRLKESKNKYTVTHYFDLKLKFRDCQDLQDFYDKSSLIKVFDQNHLNSVIIEFIFIIVILGLGFFMENTYFQIPAAASVLLFMAIIVMLIGSVSYWFRGWSTLFVLIVFFLINLLLRIGLLQGVYEAKGLNYDKPPAEYSISSLQKLNAKQHVKKDSIYGISMLNAWKENQIDSVFRPVFICVSGGGQRAALWTLNGLANADNVMKGQLMNKSVMITGASGGMIGAAYYRELYKLNLDLEEKRMLANISKDNLNSIIFSLLVNDAFFPVRTFDYEGKSYKMDRGYVFENNLNKNLDYIFNTKISSYTALERNAEI
ncbi:MAG: patatin-like phospholipase family protein, partial [Cyclobacteriaceae bacterium]